MYKTTSVAKNVLVAMTGRMDSTVTAYLLKKQGYNPIGIGLSFYTPQDVEKYGTDFLSSHHITDLEAVKNICTSFEIPFYAVNAQAIFKCLVLDKAVSSRLTGEYFNIQNIVSKIIVETLISKMEQLKAVKIATGHYARIQYSSSNGDYQLLSANDLSCDQSYELASLTQEELSHLLLPLADTRIGEVEKIAQTMGIALLPNNRTHGACESFFTSEAFSRYSSDEIPHSLKRKGPILDKENDTFCADHTGVHQFYIGQSELRGDSFAIDPRLTVIEINPQRGVVFVGMRGNQFIKHCYLKEFSGVVLGDATLPISAFAKFSPCGEKYACTLYFKNNATVMVELNEPANMIVGRGQFVVLFAKNSSGAKVLGGGNVRKVGEILVTDRVVDTSKDDDFADESEEKAKKKEVKELFF